MLSHTDDYSIPHVTVGHEKKITGVLTPNRTPYNYLKLYMSDDIVDLLV